MIEDFFTLQATKRNLEMVDELQNEMNSAFLEYAMYDINDAMTSILALCDMEQMSKLPKIKEYIQRVNRLLHDVYIYQEKDVFHVNHVLKNVVMVVRDRFPEKVHIHYENADIKAYGESDQRLLEKLLLFILIELINPSEENRSIPDVFVELHQKEQDALIMIRKPVATLSPVIVKEIEKMGEGIKGRVQISLEGEGVLITVKCPLTFQKPVNVPLQGAIENVVNPSKIPTATPKITTSVTSWKTAGKNRAKESISKY